MAVARIKLTTRQWNVLADRLKPAARTDKATRQTRNECARAADRPGLLGEFDGPEFLLMRPHAVNMPEVLAKLDAAHAEWAECAERELAKTASLRAMMDKRRGAAPKPAVQGAI